MAALNRGDETGVDASARAGEDWARSQWEDRTPIHVGSNKLQLACPGAIEFRG